MKGRHYIAVTGAAFLLGALALVFWPTRAPQFASVRVAFKPSDAFLLDRHGEVIDTLRIDMQVRRFEWQSLATISPALIAAVVQAEDMRFREHDGIDWRSVVGAVRDRYVRGRPRGASTISMQVASLLQNESHSRRGSAAWQRKLRQIRLARAVESAWTKDEILEAYLNLVHYRGELQGIAAAAYVLAGKEPSGLTLSESRVIAALLPQPNAAPQRVAMRACSRVRSNGASTDCADLERTAARLLSETEARNGTPQLAPQIADTLLDTAGQRVQSTLDAGVQRSAQNVLERHLAQLSAQNVRDGALLIVDNASGDVLAYVGSAGPQSRSLHVDGVRALRQAGSTLKPFLYALALEKRYLNAASLLKDSPVHLDTATGAYIPQDYDKQYKGLVSVRTALGNSLNIPAVRTLVLVGVEPFRDRLVELGYEHIVESGDYYGYSLALGSAEVSLWEQAQAYRTLARQGEWSPLHVRMDDRKQSTRAVVPRDVGFIVTDILSDSAARTLTFGVDNSLNTPFWSAVKTGTSKDMRDNWCVGFSSAYTVAVWVGNFEGDSMHDVSGVTGAAPVWRELMGTLHRDEPSQAPQPPDNLVAVTTQFKNALETTRREWFVRDQHNGGRANIVPAAKLARIVSPANGMVIAVDPDIPSANQKVPLSVEGSVQTARLTLNGKEIPLLGQVALWTPTPGAYQLQLEGANKQLLDSVFFTVR